MKKYIIPWLLAIIAVLIVYDLIFRSSSNAKSFDPSNFVPVDSGYVLAEIDPIAHNAVIAYGKKLKSGSYQVYLQVPAMDTIKIKDSATKRDTTIYRQSKDKLGQLLFKNGWYFLNSPNQMIHWYPKK